LAKNNVVLIALLALTEKPYSEYNTVLASIKGQLETPDRIRVFNRVLAEELPLTTARRAYRTAVRIALGEKNVLREYVPPRPRSVKPATALLQKGIANVKK
jgi:hypothetical protein